MVYPPREDSLFLAGFVKEHARGRVLDMGTGSGVQAQTAKKNVSVTEIIAVDIDKEAVEALHWEEFKVVESDMFAVFEDEKFDTIICNPPYLPNDRGRDDPDLYGGPKGYEWTLRFLREAKDYLSKDGHILLLFSSVTNKERVDRALRELGYHHEQLGELAMFFERLYVYRLWT